MFIYKYKKKKTLVQFQIDDYLGKSQRIIFDMSKPKQYQDAKKTWILQKDTKPRGRPHILQLKDFLPLEHYFFHSQQSARSPKYLTRFRIPNLRYEFLEKLPLLPSERLLYTELPYFQGHFEDIFLFNPRFFRICREITQKSSQTPISLPHPIQDYFVLEMARIHTGNESYTAFIRNMTFFNPAAFAHVLEDSQFMPSTQDFSEFFHSLPLDIFYSIFYEILNEFMELKLISFRIMLWDCQFIHTNGSDYKIPHTDQYSDRDAGIGRHQNKFLGLGYMASTLYIYCGELILPVYCMVFPANISDKDIFFDTMTGYFQQGLPRPYLILGDAGAYSVKNLRFLARHGVIGMINAPKTVKKQNIVDLRDDIHLNRDFVPGCWSDEDLLKLYYLRTVIERQFSHNVQIYHVKEVNIRGIDQIVKHRFVILILDLLKQLTAIKIGRFELIGKFTAFSLLRSGDSMTNYLRALKKEGYQLFEKIVQPSVKM